MYGKRKDTGEEMEVTYHIEEAARAGLIKDFSAWKSVPQDMLFARCISRLARRLFADCIGGCYVEGELQETILKETVTAIDVPLFLTSLLLKNLLYFNCLKRLKLRMLRNI